MGIKRGWVHISAILDDLGLAMGGLVDVGPRMVLVASMGNHLRRDESTYIAEEELTDLICHSLGVVDMMGSWPPFVRRIVEKYPLEWFNELQNCEALFFAIRKCYTEVQGVCQRETGGRLL
jgi:hypothetical protein